MQAGDRLGLPSYKILSNIIQFTLELLVHISRNYQSHPSFLFLQCDLHTTIDLLKHTWNCGYRPTGKPSSDPETNMPNHGNSLFVPQSGCLALSRSVDPFHIWWRHLLISETDTHIPNQESMTISQIPLIYPAVYSTLVAFSFEINTLSCWSTGFNRKCQPTWVNWNSYKGLAWRSSDTSVDMDTKAVIILRTLDIYIYIYIYIWLLLFSWEGGW